VWLKKVYDKFSRFDRVPACDRQTDGQTDIWWRLLCAER